MFVANPLRTNLAVPDRGERLDAEEERLAQASAEHRGTRPEQRVTPARQIGHREGQVQHEIGQSHESEKPGPGNRQQQVIRREALEDPQTRSHDVEGTVAIEQALPALAADDGAEPEIAVARLFVGSPARRQWLVRRRLAMPEDLIFRPAAVASSVRLARGAMPRGEKCDFLAEVCRRMTATALLIGYETIAGATEDRRHAGERRRKLTIERCPARKTRQAYDSAQQTPPRR
jgi:hypothetical protein